MSHFNQKHSEAVVAETRRRLVTGLKYAHAMDRPGSTRCGRTAFRVKNWRFFLPVPLAACLRSKRHRSVQ